MNASRRVSGSLLAVALLAAGCGDGSAAAAPVDAAVAAQGATELQNIVDALEGTSADRLAVEAEQAGIVQKSIAECMKNAGFSYTPARSEGVRTGPASIGPISAAPIGENSLAVAEQRSNIAKATDSRINPGYTNLTDETKKAQYGKALGPCITAAPDPDSTPAVPGITKYRHDLAEIFLNIERQPDGKALVDEYRSCMNDAGMNVKDRGDLYLLILDKYPDASVGWEKLSKQLEWSDAVHFEKEATATDTSCRTALRNYAMASALPALQKFQADNATALTKAKAVWAAPR